MSGFPLKSILSLKFVCPNLSLSKISFGWVGSSHASVLGGSQVGGTLKDSESGGAWKHTLQSLFS